MAFFLNGQWIWHGDFCYDGCGSDEIRYDECPYLLLHVGELDPPDFDEERVFPIDNLKLSPPSPNKLLDITFNLVSRMVLRFVKRFWRLQDIDDWHFVQWEEAKFFLMESCAFSPVVANYTLPSLDYLWPCAYAPATGVVPDPPLPLGPVVQVAPLNFLPAAFAGPARLADVGDDWD